jgi:hypothetical protein
VNGTAQSYGVIPEHPAEWSVVAPQPMSALDCTDGPGSEDSLGRTAFGPRG